MIDLDELERQLRAASAPRPVAPAGAPGRDDPLAELARIVGQDDPYRPSPSPRQPSAPRPVAAQPYAGAPEPAQRFETSSFEAELAALSRGEPFAQPQVQQQQQPVSDLGHAPEVVVPHASAQQAAHPDDQMASWALRTPAKDDRFQPAASQASESYAVRQDPELEPVYEPAGQLPPHEPDYAEPPRRSRRGLYAVMVVMGVAVIGVSAGFAVKNTLSGSKVASGTAPPVIKADAGPTKIAPENPGGVEVPNQDRQVFNKGVPEDTKGAKVVGGEEQPVDVNQVARQPVRQATPLPAGTTTTAAVVPAPPASAVELPKPPQATALPPGLGEPRRVKTVSVRPDGTIIDSAVDTGAGAPRTIALAAAPADSGSVASTASVPSPTQRPRAVEAAGATPAAAAAKPAQTSTATAAPTPKPPAARPTQVASTQPVAAAEATETSSGGFAVQLAAPGSEQEARETASRLSRRFSGELGDMKPAIRKAEVNGKTIYRVRVGSLSREDATALCEKLKGAGGQCFVAKN